MATSFPSPEQFNAPRRAHGAVISATSGAAISVLLSAGYFWEMTTDHDVHYFQGPAVSGAEASALATTTDLILWAKSSRYLWVYDASDGTGNNSISFKSKVGSGGGTIWYAKVIP